MAMLFPVVGGGLDGTMSGWLSMSESANVPTRSVFGPFVLIKNHHACGMGTK